MAYSYAALFGQSPPPPNKAAVAAAGAGKEDLESEYTKYVAKRLIQAVKKEQLSRGIAFRTISAMIQQLLTYDRTRSSRFSY